MIENDVLCDKFHLNLSIMDACMFLKTEQKGWLGVSGLCAHVLLAGQVSVFQVFFFLFHLRCWFYCNDRCFLWNTFTVVGCASLSWQRLKGRDWEAEIWENQWEENANSNWGTEVVGYWSILPVSLCYFLFPGVPLGPLFQWAELIASWK
jgi:hypothetical protein